MKISKMLEAVDWWEEIGQFCGIERDILALDVVTPISEQREGDFGLKVYAISPTQQILIGQRFLTIQTEYDNADNPVGFVGTYASSVAELKETINGYKGMIT